MSINAEHIRAGYGSGIDIIHDISLQAKPHQFTAIIGPNGSGKSTILKAMYGVITPRAGKVIYNNMEITKLKPHEMLAVGISYVPQERSIFPFLTVHDNLKAGAWLIRKEKNRVQEAVNRVYEIFPRLQERRKVKAGNLSGGEQKMLEFGRAMLLNPQTILVDEPTAGLAPKIAHEVYLTLQSLKDIKLTILLVDQNVRQAISLSDYMYVIELGTIKEEGPSNKYRAEMSELVKSWMS
ncbi:MAG TPA: ABC transporter ATP-binding protein [Candidatus Bathyarchaeia archaeon]|nr:ABC transporter ATP-binding protein [Candidatus Bathyarchaeia archaeon]